MEKVWPEDSPVCRKNRIFAENYIQMKHQSWLLAAACIAAFLFSACRSDRKSNIIVETQTNYVPQEHRMPDYNFSDTVRMGSHQFVYTIHREADASLPKVKDEVGDTYLDNFYQLIIERDNAAFFERRFAKSDLRPQLARDFQRNGIIDGFRFISAGEGRLQFGLCVSYPESDMSAPFILTIGPDASYSIEADDVMDVEETGDTAAI